MKQRSFDFIVGGSIPCAFVATALTLLAATSPALAALNVVSVSPTAATTSAPVSSAIVINFDRAVLMSSVNSSTIRAFGHASGPVSGAFALSNGGLTVTLTPSHPFSPGESVVVNLSHDLQAVDASLMRPAGYAFRFWVRTRHACAIYTESATMSNRLNANDITRIYGSLGSDLNRDGWIDLVTINETSADIRVFPNSANGSGLFNAWLQPPTPTLQLTSPHQPADFNNDGKIDICEGSYATGKITVLLGNGNGTFQPQVSTNVGLQPAGICVLDIDGDADMDIVNTNHQSNNLSRLFNNGSGVFTPAVFFEGGGNGEYGIASADMNNDGIFDLVVGTLGGNQVIIHLGNGNGTFSALQTKPSGGYVWQIGAGDVDRDGDEDVHVANSFANNGAILKNNGAGVLSAPITYTTGNDPVATDMGDVDGDGDLDWCLSYFNSDNWSLLLNNGAGVYTLETDFLAPEAGSCASFLDIDNDGDLDLALADELADVVIVQKNVVRPADLNCDGVVNIDDLVRVITSWGPCPRAANINGCPVDIAPLGIGGNNSVDIDDLVLVITSWG